MYEQASMRLIKDQKNAQNTLLRLQRIDKAKTKPFISKQQRFIHKLSDALPGPGAYIDPLALSKKIQKQKQQGRTKNVPGNHLDGFISKEHQWIFGNDRLNYNNGGSGIGPGAYNIIPHIIKKVSDSWSRSDRFNGTEWNQNKSVLGPGSYDARSTDIKPREKEMSIFKSRSPKSLIEQLQKDIQKKFRSKQHKKSFQPFISELKQLQKPNNNQQKQSKPIKMDPIFLSKSKRYELINPENGIAGPGSYHFANQSLIKQRKKRINSVSNSVHHIKPNESSNLQLLPGPADYQIKKYNIQKQLDKKISSSKGNMSLETRFKADSKRTNQSSTLPGPGHYNKQKFMFMNQKTYEHKLLVHHHDKVDVPFLSSSLRVIQTQKQNSPFGTYSLNQYDIAQKSRKKRQNIQKLKAIQISVPGFQSSQRRTTFNLGKIIKEHLSKLHSSYHNPQRVKSGASILKE